MSVTWTIVSIGCLSHNRFWNEPAPRRIAHATTTLIRDDRQCILVDPGLPPEVLRSLLDQRTGLTPESVDVVFLTSFRPVHRRGLALFPRAAVLMSEAEIEAVRAHLDEFASRDNLEPDVRRMVAEEQALLGRIEPAPERLTPAVHLFPTPGPTPGHASLLLVPPTRTVAIAGDAVVTRDYFEHGMVFEPCFDVEQARQSLAEIVEIADLIIPGHDNLIVVGG